MRGTHSKKRNVQLHGNPDSLSKYKRPDQLTGSEMVVSCTFTCQQSSLYHFPHITRCGQRFYYSQNLDKMKLTIREDPQSSFYMAIFEYLLIFLHKNRPSQLVLLMLREWKYFECARQNTNSKMFKFNQINQIYSTNPPKEWALQGVSDRFFRFF